MSCLRTSRRKAILLAGALAMAAAPVWAQTDYGTTDPAQPEQLPPGDFQPLEPDAAQQPMAPIQLQDGPLQIVPDGVLGGMGVGPRVPDEEPEPAFGSQGFDENIIGVAPDPLSGPMESVSEIGLGALDPSSIGVVTEERGGFPATMWEGSDRAALVALVPQLPVNTRSPTMRGLSRRLLLTEAEAPAIASDGISFGEEADPYDLLRARVERLVAAGDLPGLAALFDRLPPQTDDDALTRHRIDVMLMSGDVAGACAEADAANQRSENTYWFQIVALCRVIDGDAEGAAFATDMLRELGIDDPTYFELMAYLALPVEERQGLSADSMGAPTPLSIAMLRIAGLEVPVGALVQASPLMLRAIATTPNMSPPLRLEAADMAVRRGAIDISMLVGIYGGLEFDPSELQNASVLAQAGGGARADALLFQASRRSPMPELRASNLSAAWRVGLQRGEYAIAARANVEATQALPVSPVLMNYAASVTKALLVAGDYDGANRWYNLVRSVASAADVDATATLLELWPYMQVADSEGNIPFSSEILDLWWQSQLVQTRAERSARGALMFAVFEALGDQVPAQYWTSLYEGAARQDESMPSLPAWRGTMVASRAGRLGETVLLTLILLGEEGPGAANPAVLANVIEALRQVGLEREARALTLEALAEAGL